MKQSDIKDIAEKELAEKPEKIEKIERGLKQKTYRITVENQKYILQLSDKIGEEENGLERNIKSYQLLADTKVPVPRLITQKIKKTKINGKERKYYICECLPGENLENQMTDDLTVESGKLLAHLHNFASYEKTGWLVPDEEGFWVASFEEGSFKQYLLNEWQERIEILEKEGWNKVVKKSKKFYNKYKDDIPENIDPVFCPNDFSTDNILVENGEITGVIDFDIAYAGHSYRDLVKSANAFWMIEPGKNTGIRENFYKGYQQQKELDKSFWKLEPVYRVETITQTVASLIEMNHFNEEEKSFYREHLTRIIEEAEQELTGIFD